MMLSEILKLAIDSFRAEQAALCADGAGHGDRDGVGDPGGDDRADGQAVHPERNPEDRHQRGRGRVLAAAARPAPRGCIYNDFLTREDEKAVLAQVPSVMDSSPVLEMHDHISFGSGVVKDTLVLGVSPQYQQVRNLIVLCRQVL